MFSRTKHILLSAILIWLMIFAPYIAAQRERSKPKNSGGAAAKKNAVAASIKNAAPSGKFLRVSNDFFKQAEAQINSESLSDSGNFKIIFESPTGERNLISEADKQTLRLMTADLNSIFKLPRDVVVSFENCDEPDAAYDSENGKLLMCYELFDDLTEIFRREYKNAAERENAANGAAVFIFFHELGHALIDLYDLPVTGREEDAADQLSTLILLSGSTEGEKMALSGAMSFGLEGDAPDEDNGDLPFWDEHSFNRQRFYNIVCLVYGSNPAKHQSLVGENALPAERAALCPSEFSQANKSWSRLLAPFVKR
jgi:hypothetical protein